ncbi:hypothetical protein TB2_028580 [Malus domestica]|uniref:Uncharacterized protein n=1 Tax=Malus domestica TaxID=3750 RepID=A0A498K9N7_MALDO|nr:hypothetical protein DVH24_038281 [Malus domestica]
MGPFGLGDRVEFGDLEGDEVEGRDAGVEVKVEDATNMGNEVDDDEEEDAKDTAAYAAAAATFGERKGRLGSRGGGRTTGHPG